MSTLIAAAAVFLAIHLLVAGTRADRTAWLAM
jgi:hypothetical protein